MSKAFYNILITSVNGLTGQTVSKYLSYDKSLRLTGTDCSEYTISKIWLNSIHIVPKTFDQDFENKLISIIKNERIEFIIPTTDSDVRFFSTRVINGYYYNCKIIVVDKDTYNVFSNKKNAYNYLEILGIKTPKILNYEENKYPIIIKPIRGTGSKGVSIIEDEVDKAYWSRKIDNYILTEYLNGPEYSCDAVFSLKNDCLGYNARERIVFKNGSATVSRNTDKTIIKKIIDTLEKKAKLVGPINFQFKLNKENEPIIFDFNTRMPSGGLSLTIHSGLNIPRILVNELIGKPNKNNKNIKYKSYGLIKYYEDYFF